jgi:hypothetical protein
VLRRALEPEEPCEVIFRRPLTRCGTAGAAAQERDGRLPGTTTGIDAPTLPGMDAVDELVADVWATGLSPDTHPVQFARPELDRLGALSVAALADVPDKTRVLVGGIVPTGNALPRRAASPSSTWKTKPGCSTSPAAPAYFSGLKGSSRPLPLSWYGEPSRRQTA